MKNLYLYFAGIVILTSGLFFYRDTDSSLPTITGVIQQKKSDSSLTSEPAPKQIALAPLTATKNKSAQPLAVGLTATNSYQITKDLGAAGATPGDEIEYTTTLTAGGGAVSGITFSASIDPNTTLVPGSVQVTPVAVDEAYTTIGNVGLSITEANGLLANDVSPDGSTLSITGNTTITTTAGGSAVLNPSTGAFTYEPKPGFRGKDTFTYTIQNGSGKTSTASVSITSDKKLWFIKAGASGSSLGTLSNPFPTLAAFQSANGQTNGPAAGDSIFVFSGDYTGSITLLNNQKLVGQGASLSVTTIFQLSGKTSSSSLPGTGAAPIFTTTSGTADAVTLGQNNSLAGISIGNTTGKKIKGASFGTLNLNDIKLFGTGPAIDLATGSLALGTYGIGNIQFSEISSTSNNVPAIQTTNVIGNLNIPTGTLASTNATAIQMSGTANLALNVTLVSVSSSGAAKGISISRTTGTFTVSGTGTTAGSGGTISNISGRGAEFSNTAGITLKNMTFSNANTSDGTFSAPDNTGANAAIYAGTVATLTLNNIGISGNTSQFGINLLNVSDFNLTNSSLSNCGNSPEEGGIYATNVSGVNAITNSTFSSPSGRGIYFRNTSGTTKLTVDNTTVQDAANAEGLLFEGWENANMNLIVKNNSNFKTIQTVGIAVYSNGSANVNADILGNTIDPGTGIGTGIDIAGSGTSNLKFNVKDNIVKSRGGTGINGFATGDAYLEGNVNNNTVTALGGYGSGIAFKTEALTGNRSAKATVLIDNNTISGVTLDNAIKVSATSTNGAKTNATISNNKVTANSASSTAQALAAIDVSTPTYASANSTLCANVKSNTITGNSPSQPILFNASAESGTSIQLSGSSANVISLWNNNGNGPIGSATGNTIVKNTGNGTFTYNAAACTLPVNSALRVASPESADIAAISSVSNIKNSDTVDTLADQTEEKTTVAENATTSLRTATPLATSAFTLNGSGSGFTILANKSVVITYRVNVNSSIPANVCNLSSQGTASGTGFTVLTDDPSQSGASDPTLTPIMPTAQPTITASPANTTVCAGVSPTFSVSVTETGMSYQWQRGLSGNFTDISTSANPTAATPTLTMANVQTSDDASQYRVRIYTSCTSYNTTAGTLTVNKIESGTVSGSSSVDQNTTMPTITFTAQGGTKPYTFYYTLNNVAQTLQTTGAANSVDATQPTSTAGEYVYELTKVVDATSCEFVPATPQTVTINVTPLPVTLTLFNVTKVEKTAVLDWETTTETNSEHFDIERSSDGKSWLFVGNKSARGESSSTIRYTFTDQTPLAGENLYRLKMIDKDGTFAYSRIRSLIFDEGQETTLYPNPVSNTLTLHVHDWAKVASVQLFNVKGESVFKSHASFDNTIDVSHFPTGAYVVSIQYKDGTKKSRKIVISR